MRRATILLLGVLGALRGRGAAARAAATTLGRDAARRSCRLPTGPAHWQSQQAAQLAQQAAAVEESPDWAVTLERIASSVVSIEVDATRAFDTEWNTSAQATGFVVDAERGLILTNRHVVTPGPVTATATFLNREEVQLYPIYRDPVHDFGLYHYDPTKLHFIKPKALPLYPGRRADRPRDPRGRQQRRRAAVDSRRHPGAPRSRCARVRHRQVQRLQYLLSAGRLGHLGRLLRLAGRRHPRARRRPQRRRRERRGVELLSAARARAARAGADPAGQARDAAARSTTHLRLRALR